MDKSFWGKWSAIAEIIGAIAIVITLVYLSVQTRMLAVQTEQNTAALQANARQAALDTELGLIYQVLERPCLLIGPRLEKSESGLSEDQLAERVLINVANFRIRETFWLQYVDLH